MADMIEEMRTALEQEIAELKDEISRIGRSIASGASETMEEAADIYGEGRGQARRAARQAANQVRFAADVARENPGTTATVLSTVALLGLAAGLLLGGMFAGGGRR